MLMNYFSEEKSGLLLYSNGFQTIDSREIPVKFRNRVKIHSGVYCTLGNFIQIDMFAFP